jgi:hypothetical protein
MAKKVVLGVVIFAAVAVVGLAVLMHSSYGRETYQLIRKMHGK